MTYAEFKATVERNAFPERPARNLRTRNADLILDAVIDLQRDIPRMTRSQYTVVNFGQTAFACGVTVVPKPSNSVIKRIYTYTDNNHCDAVFYRFVSRLQLENEKKRYGTCGCASDIPLDLEVDSNDFSISTIGEIMSNEEFDKEWRAATGIYTIIGDRIHMFPHINSTENVTVEWSGIQYVFGDSDLVTWDRDIIHAAELWLRAKTALRDSGNEKDYVSFTREYAGLKADLVIRDRQEEWSDNETPEECCSPYQIATMGSVTSGDGDDDGSGSGSDVTDTCGLRIFSTVEEMLVSNKFSWCQAICLNYNPGDKFITQWAPISGSDLPNNNSDILLTADNRLIVRTYLRENFGEEIIIPPAVDTPYTVSTLTSFPTLTSFRNSKSNSQIVILAAQVDGNGGGDINGDGGFFFAAGEGVDDGLTEVINAIGVHYRRMTFV